MALFKRRSEGDADPSMPTGDPEDDKILRIISENSQLGKPRHWVHSLCFQDEEAARMAARVIANIATPATSMPGRDEAERAWVTEVTADPGGLWLVTAEQHGIVLSASLVRSAREFFTLITEQLPGSGYDGWRASR
jgi:hypothetical protein